MKKALFISVILSVSALIGYGLYWWGVERPAERDLKIWKGHQQRCWLLPEGAMDLKEGVQCVTELSDGEYWQYTRELKKRDSRGEEWLLVATCTHWLTRGRKITRQVILLAPTADDIKYSADCAINWAIIEAVGGGCLGEYLPCDFSLLPLDCFGGQWKVQMEEESGTQKLFTAIGVGPWTEGEGHIKSIKLNTDADPPCWETLFFFKFDIGGRSA